MDEDTIDGTSLIKRNDLVTLVENTFVSYGPLSKLLVRLTCMVLWLLVALLVQLIALFLLNGVFHEYVDPRPEYAESANNLGGWTLMSMPVGCQLLLGWWLRYFLTRIWVGCVAGCQILLSAYYIL